MTESKRRPTRAAPRQSQERSSRVNAPTAGELPVTRTMLGEVRTELLERIDQSKSELQAEIHQVKAGLHAVRAEVARIGLLFEEQNARNKVVLDALMALIDRQGRVERRMDQVEETVRELASSRSSG